MIMIVPYGCDAPLYYRPWATAGLIAANVLVVVLWMIGGISDSAYGDWWVLPHGSITPIQWVTSGFAHAGFWHLLGNMVFLWAFGLIAEGKLGSKRFLLLYLSLLVAQNAIEQLLMLGSEISGSLGASGVIFSLMAIALFWAPRNTMRCALIVIVRVFRFEASVLGIASFFLLWDFGWAVLGGFAMSTSMLHSLGALVGIPVAILFLKKQWVDCEGWDLLTIREHGRPKSHHFGDLAKTQQALQEPPMKANKRGDQAAVLEMIRGYLRDGAVALAAEVHRTYEESYGAWDLPVELLEDLARELVKAKAWDMAETYLQRLADCQPRAINAVTIQRARILLYARNRPGDARRLVADLQDLSPAQQQERERIIAVAAERT